MAPNDPTSPPEPKEPVGTPAWLYPLACGFLLAALFGLRLVNDADLGFHLASGRWILEHHQLPRGESFTYTAAGRPYLDMEWLYQFFLYLGFLLGGYSLLSLAHVALGLAALGILWVRLRKSGSPLWMGVLVFLAAVLSCEPRFRVRPEVLTWVILGLELWILEERRAHGRDLLHWLPALQLIWVNTEGLFFIGPAVMGIHLLTSWVHGGKFDRKLLKLSVLSLVLCLVNPHLLKGFLLPLSFISELGSSAIYQYTVQEFNPPWSFHASAHAPFPFFLQVYKFFSVALGALLLATAGKRKIQDWLLVLFFFALSASAVRNIPLFVLACAPVFAGAWKDLGWPWLLKFQDAFWAKPLTALVLTLLLLGYSARVVTNAHYVHERLTDRFGLGLDGVNKPERACRFLTENHLGGRVINDLDSGDWLDWRGPSLSFIDGRLDVMGGAFFTEYTRSQGPGGAAALIAKYQPNLFFFNPLVVPQWFIDLRKMPDWRLVYLDPCAAVFLRSGFGDSVPDFEVNYLLSDNNVAPALANNVSALLLAPPPSPLGTFLSGFFRPSDYPGHLLSLGIACGYGEFFQASELFFLEGISRTGGKYFDFYYNLGLLYEFSGRHSAAVPCMRRAALVEPDDPLVRKVLGN